MTGSARVGMTVAHMMTAWVGSRLCVHACMDATHVLVTLMRVCVSGWVSGSVGGSLGGCLCGWCTYRATERTQTISRDENFFSV